MSSAAESAKPLDMFWVAPGELQVAIREFFPSDEWENAALVAQAESGFDAFAVNDTRTPTAPCGTPIGDPQRGLTAELSIGYFQVNACNFPDWDPWRFFNARHNAGTAHMLWEAAGRSWSPWWVTRQRLGLT